MIETLKQLVPAGARRPAKRLLPARLYHLVEPDWHRKAVGGYWDEIGRLQFEFLVARGLRPEHTLLDIGCGSLRGGVHFIRYLAPAHYCGIDRSREVLRAGRNVELKRYGLEDKRPTLVHLDDLDLPSLGRTFSHALAQSVFTHVPVDAVEKCVANVDRVLEPGGRFYATFNEADEESEVPADPSKDPFYKEPTFHYPFDVFREAREGTGLGVDYIGDWGHPRGQAMMVFTKGERE